MVKVTPDEVVATLEKYMDHPIYRSDVMLLLSPEGREWFMRELKMIKDLEKKE